MNIQLDVHTHTIVSGHAYSTIQEMAKAASEKGLRVLGITEHGPRIPGSCHPIYFDNLHVIPRRMYDVRLLMGCEINILNLRGDLDLPDTTIKKLDLRIAGIHSLCWEGGTKEENTAALIRVIQNPLIHIISHPGDGVASLDFEPIARAAADSHTLLEVNSHSMRPTRNMIGARKNNMEILRLCKQMNVPVILGSDAHISFDIANYENALPLMKEVDFPKELVMNYNADRFFEYLGIENL